MSDSEELNTGLAPGFLVAAPTLIDPNFAGSVVLMAEHHSEGSLGFIVNRPAPIAVSDILSEVDEGLLRQAEATGRAGSAVLLGGPVQPERLWIMFRPKDFSSVVAGMPEGEGLFRLDDEIAVGGSRELLDAVVRSRKGTPFHLVLGYAGWGPLQVEHEVGAGAWLPLVLHRDLIFDVPLAQRWEEAVRRLGLTPGAFSMGGGGAQA